MEQIANQVIERAQKEESHDLNLPDTDHYKILLFALAKSSILVLVILPAFDLPYPDTHLPLTKLDISDTYCWKN